MNGRRVVLGRPCSRRDCGTTPAEEWQRDGRPFAGLLFGHQLRGTIGQYVEDLELVARASEADEWMNRIEYLPF